MKNGLWLLLFLATLGLGYYLLKRENTPAPKPTVPVVEEAAPAPEPQPESHSQFPPNVKGVPPQGLPEHRPENRDYAPPAPTPPAPVPEMIDPGPPMDAPQTYEPPPPPPQQMPDDFGGPGAVPPAFDPPPPPDEEFIPPPVDDPEY